MSTPQMPHIPGAAAMTDTLDFVKNLWGSLGVPGLATPTLSVDELDKKINDLKAVESWLNLNTAMLRSSIQALEVQRNTIATLKTMGKTFAETMQQPGSQDKSLFDANPYAAAFFQHLDPARAAAKPAASAPAPAPERPAEKPLDEKPADQKAANQKAADPAAAAAAQMANPAAWWNMLQEQFTQAVSTAMAEAKPAAAAPQPPAAEVEEPAVNGAAPKAAGKRAPKAKS